MKKFAKILAIMFAFFVVVMVGLTIFVKVVFPAERIKAMLAPVVSELTGRDVEIKDASVSVFPVIGFSIDSIKIKNTERTIVVKSDTTLSSYLTKFRLEPAYSIVKVNDSLITGFVDTDYKLKKGEKVAISRKGFSQDEALFAMKNITVNVKFMPLLKKKVEISKVLFDGISVLVEADKRGSFNFEDMIPPADTTKEEEIDTTSTPLDSLPIDLSLESFEIRDARIIYRNLKDEQEIVLGDIDQHVDVIMDKTMDSVLTKGLLEVKNVSVSGKGLPIEKSDMKLIFSHDLYLQLKSGNLTINEMKAGFQKNVITVKGSVNNFLTESIGLDVALQTNVIKLEELFAEIPPALSPEIRKIKTSGTMQLGVAVKGELDTNNPQKLPKINGSFVMNNILVKYTDLPKSINNLNADIKFTENSLNMSKFGFNLGENPISVKALVQNFLAPKIDVAVKANLDLAIVKDVVPLPEGVSVSGKINSDLTAKGEVDPKDPTKIAVNGGVDFLNIVATTPEVKKPVELDGAFLFSNEKLNLKDFKTVIGTSSVTTNMNISNYLGLILPKKANGSTVITFSMISPNFNVNEILGLDIEKLKKENSSKTTTPTSTPTEDGTTGDEPIIIPELPNVVFDGKIKFNKIDILTLPISNASMDLSYKNRKVDLDMGSTLFAGRITEKMNADFTSKTIKVTNIFTSNNMEGNDFISAFNDILTDDGSIMSLIKSLDNTIYGKMNLNTKLSSAGYSVNQFKRNLAGNIDLKLYDGLIKSENIMGNIATGFPKEVVGLIPSLKNLEAKKFEAKFGIKDEKILINQLETETKNGDFSMTGSSTFTGVLDLDTDVRFNKSVSDKMLNSQTLAKEKVADAANKAIKNDLLNKVVSQGINNAEIIPSDKEGRVTAVLNISGPTDNLKYSFKGFKGDATVVNKSSIEDDLKSKAKAEADKLKAQAQAKIDAEKQKLEAKRKEAEDEAKRKIEEAKAKAKAEADKKKAEAKKKAEDKAKEGLNKLKKGFGF